MFDFFQKIKNYARRNNINNNDTRINKEYEDKEYQNKEYEDKEYPDNLYECIEYKPPIIRGKVLKVYDGDTITIGCKLNNNDKQFYKFSIRINNVDCPEIRTKDINEKKAGLFVRDQLANKILNKIVEIKDIQNEKYGRILANVICDNVNIGDWLIINHFAVEYHGKTKYQPEKSWIYYIDHPNLI